MTAPQPAAPPARSEMFAALAVPNFRRYVSGQSLSLIGTWVETVAPEHYLPEPLSQAETRVLRFLQTSVFAPEISVSR